MTEHQSTPDRDEARIMLHFPIGWRRRVCIWGWSVWAILWGGKVEIIRGKL